jgi:uncharacterized membrane protein
LTVLLALAYLGIGYVAWKLALLIPGYMDRPLKGTGALALPALAALIMLAWDLSMDPDWSTLDRAWIWQDGGAYFGVPLSNFFGWFVTGCLYYLAFTLYCRATVTRTAPAPPSLWLPAILFYAVCAGGNLFIVRLPMAAAAVTDASGRNWLTTDILRSCVLVSLFVMAPFASLAWLRVRTLPAAVSRIAECKE